jgi:predicted Zn finger-like uncharacterized protein
VVVICPKCKTKLKVDEKKLKAEGSRFKCPRCSTVLLVKKPAPVYKKSFDNNKVLVAHSNPNIVNEISGLLISHGLKVVSSSDGIDAMVKITKEQPFLVLIEVGLPKIYGFEVCKRLKSRPETRGTKFILISSIYDKDKYKREPSSLYEADDYIEEHQLGDSLIGKVQRLTSGAPGTPVKEKKEQPRTQPQPETPPQAPAPETGIQEKPVPEIKTEKAPDTAPFQEQIERAKRLARTIISDIFLYNSSKAEQSLKNDTFFSDFAAEIKEGMKLYESRIPQEVRDSGEFFNSTIREQIELKKQNHGL